MFQFISVLIISALIAADRVTKAVAVSRLSDGTTHEFLGGLFRFRYVENTGAAFSVFSDSTAVLTVFTVLVIILCLFVLMARKNKSLFVSACLIMIVAGGIGNVIDRIMNGYVVDFIEPLFMKFAVFNVADCFITVSAVLLICYEIYALIQEKKQAKDGKAENDDRKD